MNYYDKFIKENDINNKYKNVHILRSIDGWILYHALNKKVIAVFQDASLAYETLDFLENLMAS